MRIFIYSQNTGSSSILMQPLPYTSAPTFSRNHTTIRTHTHTHEIFERLSNCATTAENIGSSANNIPKCQPATRTGRTWRASRDSRDSRGPAQARARETALLSQNSGIGVHVDVEKLLVFLGFQCMDLQKSCVFQCFQCINLRKSLVLQCFRCLTKKNFVSWAFSALVFENPRFSVLSCIHLRKSNSSEQPCRRRGRTDHTLGPVSSSTGFLYGQRRGSWAVKENFFGALLRAPDLKT